MRGRIYSSHWKRNSENSFPYPEDVSSLLSVDLFLLLPAVSVWPEYRFSHKQNDKPLYHPLFCLQYICLPSVHLSFCIYFLLFLPCPFPFSFAMLPIVFFHISIGLLSLRTDLVPPSSSLLVCCIFPVFQLRNLISVTELFGKNPVVGYAYQRNKALLLSYHVHYCIKI